MTDERDSAQRAAQTDAQRLEQPDASSVVVGRHDGAEGEGADAGQHAGQPMVARK